MKKILLSIVLLSLSAVFMTGCTDIFLSDPAADTVSEFNEKTDSAVNGGEATVAQNVGEAKNESSDFNAQDITDNITVEGYTYSDYTNNLVLVLKNNSDYDCELNVSVDFYNKNDSIVGTQDQTIDVFSAHTENALIFDCDDEFSTYKYEIKASEHEDYYYSVNDQLSCEVNIATDKAIISATNNGDKTAEFVQYYALFFYGDKLVYAYYGYVEDEDCEIKPGCTEKETAYCYQAFDSVKAYLNGRGSVY